MSSTASDTLPAWVLPLNGSRDLSREEVGGKAWSINRMRAMGIPTPPAVALTIDACRLYQAEGSLPDSIWAELADGLGWIEAATGRSLGAAERPLLVSVRSGAARSMPGMMDTVLNLGWTDAVQTALTHESGDPAFASDTRRRFEQEFRRTVLDDPAGAIPAEPMEQLRQAVLAVLRSWTSPRALAYRQHHGLSDVGGTAVTIQAMVYGNLDDRSGTGVLFSRNPLTGDPSPFGEWLGRAQGEDVVSGRFTPQPLEQMKTVLPEAHAALLKAAAVLEADGRDIQDIEFTVQAGRLWLLQTRAAKRSPRAAVRLAVALCREGLISPQEALARVAPDQVQAMMRPQLDPAAAAAARVLATGEPACPGFAWGRMVADADTVAELGDGEDLVLVRDATSPEDVHGMIVAKGIVTATGGATSHAAVISREIGVPCIVGCGEGVLALAGQVVTLDGAAGKVFEGRLSVLAADRDDPDLATLALWATDAPSAHSALLLAALATSA